MPGPYALSGSGIQTLGPVAGLSAVLTSKPAYVDRGTANPPNWYRVGELRLGSALGYLRVAYLDADTSWIPAPPGVDRVGYALPAGVAVTLTEIPIPAAGLTTMMPWDRGPQAWTRYAAAADVGGTPATTAWTYTVPAGKLLSLSDASIVMERNGVASAAAIAQCFIYVDAIPLVVLADGKNALADLARAEFGGGPIILPAGTVVRGEHSNPDVGGGRIFWLVAAGFLFNA